jgi:hypothetical protein
MASKATKQAYNDLVNWEAQKPADYVSQNQSQIDSLNNTINNRHFDYTYTTDPSYQQYANQYRRQAEKASENAQASASALTGGFANSYATTAGANAYQQQMSGLDSVISNLRAQALDEYNSETNDLNTQLEALEKQESDDQARWQSDQNNYYDQLNYYQNQYATASQRDANTTSNWIAGIGMALDAALTFVATNPQVLAMFL